MLFGKMFHKLTIMNTWHLIFLISLMSSYTWAISEEELKTNFIRLVMKCNKNFEMDMTELTQLQTYVIPKKTATNCIMACAYKEAQIMTRDGFYNLERAYMLAEQLKNGDEQRLINGKKLADICVKVNEEKVSDGEKGCERATLIFKCTVENAPKFGFKL